MIRKLLSKIIRTRVRMDLRDGSPMVMTYFLGLFVEAAKYNRYDKMFYPISVKEYLEGLSK